MINIQCIMDGRGSVWKLPSSCLVHLSLWYFKADGRNGFNVLYSNEIFTRIYESKTIRRKLLKTYLREERNNTYFIVVSYYS